MKTVKFSEVVKKCGRPSIYLAWVDPVRDRVLKRALSEHRVMTLHQELHGGKKDFGRVGYLKDRHAQLLIFPKSLRRFAERRVIAIDYALIASDSPVSGTAAGRTQPPERKVRFSGARPSVQKPPAEKTRVETRPEPRNNSNQDKASLPPSNPVSIEKLTTEVRRAVSELGAGKSVPAYQRLQRLLALLSAQAEPHDRR
jgi:hypothetical protein